MYGNISSAGDLSTSGHSLSFTHHAATWRLPLQTPSVESNMLLRFVRPSPAPHPSAHSCAR